MATPSRTVRLNTDTNFLKLIAIASMLIDHLGAAIFPQQDWMRIVGRLAFPIFAYCIAVGSVYTRSVPKYLLRVFVMALVSQPFYVLALNHVTPAMDALNFSGQPLIAALQWYFMSLQYANIMFALALGLLLIWSIKEKRFIVAGVQVVAVWYLSPYLSTSYGWRGVVLMLLFYAFIDRPLTSFVWLAGFMGWWGFYSTSGMSLLAPKLSIQAFALMALPLIYLPMNTRIKLNKWVFYLFYPLHLALIYAVAYFR